RVPEYLIPGLHEGPGHAAPQMGQPRWMDVHTLCQLQRPQGIGVVAQVAGCLSLTPRPAPVEGGVITGEGDHSRLEAAEGEDQAIALGRIERAACRMEAGAVHFRCGGGERGRDRSAPTGDYPVRFGNLEPDPVRDVPDRGCAPEEALDLVTARHGELRGDGAPPAAID